MASTVDSAAEQLSKLGVDGAFADSAPNLKKNLHLLSPEQAHVMLKCYPFFFSFFWFLDLDFVYCDWNLAVLSG